MKTFEEIYKELQDLNKEDLISAWEEAQKEKKKSKKIAAIICLALDIVCLPFLLKGLKNSDFNFFTIQLIFMLLMFNVMIFVITFFAMSKNQKKYNEKYKNIVIKKLIDNFYTNLEYFPSKEMPEYIYNQAQYNEYYNRYHSDDYLEAQIDNKYSIQMAEVLTQEENTHTDSDGDTTTTTITKFHGLFAKIQLDKSINSELQIMQNGKIFSNKNKLKMDSSKFENYFDVKASNQIIAMQLLTADVMEDLTEFIDKTNIRYDVSLKNDVLYLRFHSGEMFEAGSIKNGQLDPTLIKKYFYMLNFTYNLSKKFINLINDTQI